MPDVYDISKFTYANTWESEFSQDSATFVTCVKFIYFEKEEVPAIDDEMDEYAVDELFIDKFCACEAVGEKSLNIDL